MGKPVVQARAEVDKCAWVCDYYAENAESFLATEVIETDASKSFVAFEPLGVVLAIMPWNFPLWQVFRFAAPALMAGNTGVLKHASNVQGCSPGHRRDSSRRGLSREDAFRSPLIGSAAVEPVIEHPLSQSHHPDRQHPGWPSGGPSKAGALLKKTVLELGGSDPYVIFEDADLDAAVESCIIGRHDQQRAELYRRQAVHRAAGHPAGLRREVRRQHAGAEDGRSRWMKTQTSDRWPASIYATSSTPK